ncbi:MAG: flagellar biosynthetic protein FliO [Actinomycetota bacterium]|nr:flagellar biosynthetic protein FliO [Actinomycetota bacterium]MDQ2958776.1 flagellar biosynthetic protein FliO [Actinomycetota bacterium]
MNTVAIIGRMLLALVVVLGLMWCLARWARKPMGAGKADRVMTVLARQQISRTSSVTVLRVMDRALVLGVTEQGVRLITETELAPIEEALATEPASSRAWPRLRPTPAEALEAADSADADEESPLSRVRASRGSLEGSVLSVNTWRQVLSTARDLTVRK